MQKPTVADRVSMLHPAALEASRTSPVSRYVGPLLSHVWKDAPKSGSIAARCAWVEREVLRRVPLGLTAGELLAGRVDTSAAPLEPIAFGPHTDMHPQGQRAHTALDAERLLRHGISGVETEIRERFATANAEQRDWYEAALVSLQGFRELAARLREMAVRLSREAQEQWQREEMAKLARVLRKVPEGRAHTFYEAIQAVHLLYLAGSLTVQALYGPGRIDRILWPYYKRDLLSGRITRDDALGLLCCQFLLMNYVFTTPQPVMIGGVGADHWDTTNDLTFLCLEADRIVGLVNPSLAIGVNEQTPPDLLERAADALTAGGTKPSLFNDRVIIGGLQQLGVPFEDAVDYVHSTCVEITISSRSNIMVASPYINLLKPLEFMLNRGSPMRGGANDFNNHTRMQPPALDSYQSFDAFRAEYKRQLAGKIEDAAASVADVRRRRTGGWAFPLVSCFTRDCVEKGLDLDRGARYIWTETSNVGLANLVDSLTVIRRRVFEDRSLTLAQLRDVLLSDFADEGERARLCLGLPRYGNDDAEVDALAGEIVEHIYSEHRRHRDGSGGWFVPGFFCWIMHRVLGEQTAASPDGRRAGEVLADAAGAAQGRDSTGPTAAIRSITSWPHEPGIGGIVLNLRVTRGGSSQHLVDLIRTYFDLGGFEIQVNAVSSDVLRDAQTNPEPYGDLLVRVAGYSDYFTLLDPKMQDEIIRRTEHAV